MYIHLKGNTIIGSGHFVYDMICSPSILARRDIPFELRFSMTKGSSQLGSNFPFYLPMIIGVWIDRTRSPFWKDQNSTRLLKALDIRWHCKLMFCWAASLSSSRASNCTRYKLAFSLVVISLWKTTFDDVSCFQLEDSFSSKDQGVWSCLSRSSNGGSISLQGLGIIFWPSFLVPVNHLNAEGST